MRILIKLGGTLLEDPDSRSRLVREIAQLAQTNSVVVVHGGGKQMTRFLAERGVESRFINGLRVTTPEVIDAVLKVFTGSVNHQLIADFSGAGVRAVGLSGLDAGLVVAERMSDELGEVGRPVCSDSRLLNLLTAHSYLPVVACVGGDGRGAVLNVNADQMAAACAAGFEASRLYFLTDVDGVRGPGGSVLAHLAASAIDELITAGTATGGMQAKLEAARDALRRGLPEVRIAPGAAPGIIAKLMEGVSIGTRITA